MGTSVSRAIQAHARTIFAALAALALTLTLAPSALFADDSVAGPLAGPGYEGDARSASPNSAPEGPQSTTAPQGGEGSNATPTLASMLAGSATSIVSADVSLDSAEPVIGSFTVDGLTYAVGPDGLTLVAIVPDAVSGGAISIPATVIYDGVTYPVTAIGPYAFYLSGATSVELPESILSVDDRAFRSSDVARVEVAADNPNIASFDGCLYDSQLTSLLLIPEGRAGAVLLPETAEVAQASKFSHCSLVDAISVEEGGADFASWDGLLYDASGTTLLRVPAGATEITIRDGCTTIAAGAMEGCAKLERINAPATVTSISPDVFETVPTVALPAQAAMQDDSQDGFDNSIGAEGEAEVPPRRVVASSQGGGAEEAEGAFGSEVPTSPQPPSASSAESADAVASSLLDQAKESADFIPQLTAMVALSTVDDDLPEVDPASIEVVLPEGVDSSSWQAFAFSIVETPMGTQAAEAASYAAAPYTLNVYANGGQLVRKEVYRFNGGSTPVGEQVIGGSSTMGVYFWEVDASLKCCTGIPFTPASGNGTYYSYYGKRTGYTCVGFNTNGYASTGLSSAWNQRGSVALYAIYHANTYTVAFALNGGPGAVPPNIAATYDQNVTLPAPAERQGYRFLGWNTAADGSGTMYQPGAVRNLADQDGATVTIYAQWERVDFDIGFDVDSEPGDADYPGDKKDDQAVSKDDGPVPIEDPKRPGYVFEGWVIPTEDGTEAIDQDLVYQGSDGKWYVDASKLPDYAGDDGRVELTARWTAALSVDAPISATFMYDLSAWDGTESRDAYVEGSSTVKNRSAVPIRVSGIESKAGDAAGVLKRSDGTTLADAGATDEPKVLSVFPTTSAVTGTEGDAKGPASDDVADDLAHKVDMALSDVKLEAAFDHGAWAVDAATVGDNGVTVSTGDLKLGYRLNLGSATGVTLDEDALLAVTGDPDSGAANDAAIANLTYCFAAEGLIPTGAKSDPLWVEVTDPEVGSVGVYGLADIKRAAEDFSSRVDPSTDPNDQDAIYAQLAASPYFELFRQLLEHDVSFQVEVDGRYLPLQLLGICQDTKTDGTGKAGLTFQMRDVYAFGNVRSDDAGLGTFDCRMNLSDGNSGGWGSSALRRTLQSTFWGYLPTGVQNAIVGVDKCQQLHQTEVDPVTKTTLQVTADETVWLPSMHEVFGTTFASWNDSEALPATGSAPFQYMAYQGNAGSATNAKAIKAYNGLAPGWWLRSASQSGPYSFCGVDSYGGRGGSYASAALAVVPCFCL